MLSKHFPVDEEENPWDANAGDFHIPPWDMVPHRFGIWKERRGRENVMSGEDREYLGYNSSLVDVGLGGPSVPATKSALAV